jgi:hypothetical protein
VRTEVFCLGKQGLDSIRLRLRFEVSSSGSVRL